MNFPNTHHLSRAPGVIGQADVIIGMELSDYWATVNAWIDNGDHGHGIKESRIKPGTKLISISSVDLLTKANYQDFQRFQVVDVHMAADAESTLPALIEAVKAAIPADRKAAIEKRGEASRKAKAEARERNLAAMAVGWDASPISTARLTMEIWAQIKDLDWSMVGSDRQMSSWPSRIWPMEKHYHHLGHSGGFGLGYNLSAAVGAALANKPHGRFSVNLQPDGDFMYSPGVLWTAAHHQIPMLTVMHNNRGYHQEVMHVQRLSNRRNRVASLGKTMGPIGTSIEAPDIDYAKMASSMGWWSAGPIKDPARARADAQARGRGGEVRPARAGRRLDAAALRGRTMRGMRVTAGLAALAASLVIGQRRGARGVRREGQGRLHEVRLLGVPRHGRAGRRHRPEARARSDAGRGVHRLRAHHQSRDAALSRGGAARTRTSPTSTPTCSRSRRRPTTRPSRCSTSRLVGSVCTASSCAGPVRHPVCGGSQSRGWPGHASAMTQPSQIQHQPVALAARAADHDLGVGGLLLLGQDGVAVLGLARDHPLLAGAADAELAGIIDVDAGIEQHLRGCSCPPG